MAIYSYRSKAKIVGLISLMFSTLMLFTLITVVALGAGVTNVYESLRVLQLRSLTFPSPSHTDLGIPEGFLKGSEGFIRTMWIFFVFWAGTIILHLYASIQFYQSTEVEMEPREAEKIAKSWFIVTIMFFILTVVSGFMTWWVFGLVFSLASFAIISISLYFVAGYVTELQTTARSNFQRCQVPYNL